VSTARVGVIFSSRFSQSHQAPKIATRCVTSAV
jgi:hypothetical protein